MRDGNEAFAISHIIFARVGNTEMVSADSSLVPLGEEVRAMWMPGESHAAIQPG